MARTDDCNTAVSSELKYRGDVLPCSASYVEQGVTDPQSYVDEKERAFEALSGQTGILALESKECEFIVGFGDALFIRNLEFWLVSELCWAGDLERLIRYSMKVATNEEVAAVMYCVVSALATIHSFGIYHGYLKLENMLVDRRLKLVKLCDFGSSKIEILG